MFGKTAFAAFVAMTGFTLLAALELGGIDGGGATDVSDLVELADDGDTEL